MKRRLIFTLAIYIATVTICVQKINAQSWNIGGNIVTRDTTLGTKNAFALNMITNNIERMRISSVGRVGIGTKTPESLLSVFKTAEGTATADFRNTSAGPNISWVHFGPAGDWYIRSAANTGNVIMQDQSPNGKVGIGTTSPAYKLDVAGRMRIQSGGGSAGTWFMNAANTADAAFVGMQNDNHLGLWGNSVANWGLVMNTTNGNVGIGTLTPEGYKTKISHGAGTFGLDIENAVSADDWEFYVFSNLELRCNGYLRGVFNCTTGAYTRVSDERLKTNIKPMNSMLNKINQLKPSTYYFKTAPGQEYNGFIAQEVMKIFPDLVTRNVNKERKLDTYTLDYSGFGVLAIKGIQELQVLLEDKDQQITVLKNDLDELKNLLISKGVVSKSDLTKSTSGSSLSKASLAQNIPNPSNGTTTLGYYLPNEVKKASMEISSIDGVVLKSYPLAQTGNGQLTINSKDLPSGIYIYTLVVNGNKFASKKMIIAN